jgi:hypothetical protein
MNRVCALIACVAVVSSLEPRCAEAHAPAEVQAAEEPSTLELARQDQNPITRFYVMRFENNIQLGYGPHDEAINFFRFQPLIPIELTSEWVLLTRLVVPVVHQPWPESNDGVGDISMITFLTPARGSRFIWGVGPGLLLPTATKAALGSEKFSAGPAVAAVYTTQRWVVGVVAQNLWSFAGDNDRSDIHAMTLRPLVNYNLPHGWYLTTSPSFLANWEADDSDRWLVPVGGGLGKVFRLGEQRLSSTLESYYHAERPEIGPEWQLRVQLSLLYPE